MLCDDCKKRAATIFFKEVLPGKVVELHLCDECASKRGLVMHKKMSPIELLQKLLKERSTQDEKVICPVCCLSLAEFKRRGRFGCSSCVSTFRQYINNLIKKLHQSDRHIGRKPGRGQKRAFEVLRLREELKQALAREAYEEAAEIRDKLRNYGVTDAE
jgi:protein arginine kinase activator